MSKADPAGKEGGGGGDGGGDDHPGQPELSFQAVGVPFQRGDGFVQMGQLYLKKIFNFCDLLHDPPLVGFNGGDAFIQAVNIGRQVFGRHGAFTGKTQTFHLRG